MFLLNLNLKYHRPFSVSKDVCGGRLFTGFVYLMPPNLSLKPFCYVSSQDYSLKSYFLKRGFSRGKSWSEL